MRRQVARQSTPSGLRSTIARTSTHPVFLSFVMQTKLCLTVGLLNSRPGSFGSVRFVSDLPYRVVVGRARWCTKRTGPRTKSVRFSSFCTMPTISMNVLFLVFRGKPTWEMKTFDVFLGTRIACIKSSSAASGGHRRHGTNGTNSRKKALEKSGGRIFVRRGADRARFQKG